MIVNSAKNNHFVKWGRNICSGIHEKTIDNYLRDDFRTILKDSYDNGWSKVLIIGTTIVFHIRMGIIVR